jgi:hypothetical protein
MHVDPFGLRRPPRLALVLEVADQLLLLGVDADDGLARRDERAFALGDVAELSVPIRMIRSRLLAL